MRYVLIIIALVLNHSGYSQTAAETKLSAALAELNQAIIKADRPRLERLTMDQLSYGHSGGLLESRDQFIGRLMTGESDFVTMDVSDERVTVSKKTGITRFIMTAKTNDAGKPAEVHLRVMMVWQKIHGKWKLLARQAIKMT